MRGLVFMAQDFEAATIKSFKSVKADVEELKRSMNEWVIFLDGSLRDARAQVAGLKRKINELESQIDTMSGR